MSKEAMKLALEALQTLHDENMDYLTRNKLGGENNQCMVFAREAITALQKALAEPDFWEGYVPEPVKPAQPQVRTGNCLRVGVCASEGHKIQAQRTWVGLLWGNLPEDGQNHDFLRGAVWAEAKLKELNT